MFGPGAGSAFGSVDMLGSLEDGSTDWFGASLGSIDMVCPSSGSTLWVGWPTSGSIDWFGASFGGAWAAFGSTDWFGGSALGSTD